MKHPNSKLVLDFFFSTKIPVRITDLNYGSHVGNEVLLCYFQEARTQYLKQFHYSETSITQENKNQGLILSEFHARLTQEILYGNELLIYVRTKDWRKVRFTMEYQILKRSTEKISTKKPSEKFLEWNSAAHGYTIMVSFDYSKKKIALLPKEFVQKLQDFENHSKESIQ